MLHCLIDVSITLFTCHNHPQFIPEDVCERNIFGRPQNREVWSVQTLNLSGAAWLPRRFRDQNHDTNMCLSAKRQGRCMCPQRHRDWVAADRAVCVGWRMPRICAARPLAVPSAFPAAMQRRRLLVWACTSACNDGSRGLAGHVSSFIFIASCFTCRSRFLCLEPHSPLFRATYPELQSAAC